MATYQGRSQAIHVGGSGAALKRVGGHGWRLAVPGTQVVGSGASATVEFATTIADTDRYWAAGTPNKIKIPSGLGGVYVLGADGFTPSYLAGLIFEVVIESGGNEVTVQTLPPKSENPMTGFQRVFSGAVMHVKVTNTTGSSRTIEKGSFTGALLLPDLDDLCIAAQYLFNDAEGSSVAIENIGGLNGTVGGDAFYDGCSLNVTGHSGSTFVSSTDPILAPNDEGSMTAWMSWPQPISAWIRDNSGVPDGDNGWLFPGRVSGVDILNEIYYRVGGTEVRTGLSLSFLTNELLHYAVTWDSTGSAFYIAGIRLYSGPPPGATDIVLPWRYGKNGEFTDYHQGRIADFRIFNCRLTDSQVASINAAGSPCA